MRSFKWLFSAVIASAFTLQSPLLAANVGLVDSFEDGTTQGWRVNLVGMGAHPVPPLNVTTNGPQGAGDNFLLITSLGGQGSASRLTAANTAQWSGDYSAAGIDAIAMDVNNFGNGDLFLRLAFEDVTVGPPLHIAYSSDPILVPQGSGWQSIIFPIAPAFLTAGIGDVSAALMHTTVLRLYHSEADNFPNPTSPIPAVVAQVGVDNITALPEPSMALLLTIGGAALLARCGRRSRAETL